MCSGGEASAVTNCLNFGNPYNPEVYWQFVESIKGMSKACEKFSTPVTGGNVSFYNQSSDEGPVFPTPTIGMLGLLPNKENRMSLDFKAAGDFIYLVGESVEDINASEYLASYHKIKNSLAPHFNLDTEFELQETIKELIKNKLVASAHDVADGGLFIALLESAMPQSLGFNIHCEDELRKDAYLFGEAQSRVICSVKPEQQEAFVAFMAESDISFTLLGEVNSNEIVLDEQNWGSIAQWKDRYDNALGNYLNN